MTLIEIVLQLLSCDYECQAGKLENNVAFQELMSRALNEGCTNTMIAGDYYITTLGGECSLQFSEEETRWKS